MNKFPSILRTLPACAALLLFAVSANAEGPPSSDGTISNPTLVANQNIAKAQAAGVITTFMGQGTKTCDQDGKNCHSAFGSDDSLDYTSMQASAANTAGVQSYSFMGGKDGQDSNAISAQTGTLALACGDTSAKTVSGIAVKATNCLVNANGDAQVTMQVCSAPARGNPVTPPKNAVQCSTDPSSPNFRAPAGKVCIRPTCDTEPVNSLNGWSEPVTLTFQSNMPASATPDDKAKNGLALSFYPPLDGQVTGSFTTDSDNMTALKIVQTFVNSQTKRTAVGLRIAYRHKATVTKDMMVQGPSAVPNPGQHSAQWDTLSKLQSNPLIPQYQAKYAKNGTECIDQLQQGVATDGKITVCDPNYSNESGIRPIATTAQIAAEGQNCSTTPQCLQEVVNTNTWTETCQADVPLSMRSCETKTDYTLNELTFTRTRQKEVCHEQRTSMVNSCVTAGSVAGQGCVPGQPCVRVTTCNVGQQYQVQMVDSSGMGNDDCQGGDWVQAAWTCTNDDYPGIMMTTNGHDGTIVSAAVPNNGSTLVSIDGSCYGKFENQTSCVNGQCNGAYTLRIGSMVCGGSLMAQLQSDAANANCTQNPDTGSWSCTTGDSGATCSANLDDSGYVSSKTCSQIGNPSNSCTSYNGFGGSCTCDWSQRVFSEHGFGAASSITVPGSFSMAAMYGVSQNDQCSPYE